MQKLYLRCGGILTCMLLSVAEASVVYDGKSIMGDGYKAIDATIKDLAKCYGKLKRCTKITEEEDKASLREFCLKISESKILNKEAVREMDVIDGGMTAIAAIDCYCTLLRDIYYNKCSDNQLKDLVASAVQSLEK